MGVRQNPMFPLLVLALLAGCHSVNSGVTASPALHVVTGLQSPEDIEVLDDNHFLLLSQIGGMDGTPGNLALFDRRTEQHSVLYPTMEQLPNGAGGWGDGNCPGEPGATLSPHGISLRRLPDDRRQLLVVNHGGRESVEFFELRREGSEYRLKWRGCAVAPADSFLNDVVGLPDGRFLVTHMFDKSVLATPEGQASAYKGGAPGRVWLWQRGQGFITLPGTELPFPNGIQADTVGRYAYINIYGENQVVKYDLRQNRVVARAAVRGPDNSSWAPDGRLLVASQTGEVDSQYCIPGRGSYCPMAFRIVALNPETMEDEVIFKHEGAPMGAGTVAVLADGALYIGSFAGDRLMRVELRPDQ